MRQLHRCLQDTNEEFPCVSGNGCLLRRSSAGRVDRRPLIRCRSRTSCSWKRRLETFPRVDWCLRTALRYTVTAGASPVVPLPCQWCARVGKNRLLQARRCEPLVLRAGRASDETPPTLPATPQPPKGEAEETTPPDVRNGV